MRTDTAGSPVQHTPVSAVSIVILLRTFHLSHLSLAVEPNHVWGTRRQQAASQIFISAAVVLDKLPQPKEKKK